MASLILRAFGVYCTFRLAIWRQTNVLIFTRTHCDAIHFMAIAIWSAWTWSTHVNDCGFSYWFVALRMTRCKWIAGVTIDTNTCWHMIHWQTFGIQTANAGTRIFTFVSNASTIGRTVWAQYAFWSAPFVRISSVIFNASAWTNTIALCAFGIRTARRWFAWIYRFVWPNNALHKWISSIWWRANTWYSVTDDMAFSICPARAGARIYTFVIDAGLLRWTIGIDNTFWSTIWWSANVAGHALTRWRVAVSATLRIRTARRRYAWIVMSFIFANRQNW